MKLTKTQAQILADRPQDCIAEALSNTFDWDYDEIDEKATDLLAGLECQTKPELPDELDKHQLWILYDAISGNTIMARAQDAIDGEEYTTQQYAGLCKSFKSLIKKLKTLGCEIEDSWEHYY